MSNKIYLDARVSESDAKKNIYFTGNTEDKHYVLRFAGNPKFIVKEYVKQYGLEKGTKLCNEMFAMLLKIQQQNFSPYVLYIYDQRNNKRDNIV